MLSLCSSVLCQFVSRCLPACLLENRKRENAHTHTRARSPFPFRTRLQFSEDGYDSQFSQSSSNQVTRTQRSAPFMFSFGDGGKKKARILVDGSQWSDDFPIDSVGWSAPISVAASPERQNNTGCAIL